MGCCSKSCANIASAVCCALGFIFFIIAAAGNSDQKNTLEDVPWAAGEIGIVSPTDVFLGTSAVSSDEGATKYSESCGSASWCGDCESAGSTGVAMASLSLILAVVCLVMNVLQLTGKDAIAFKIVAIVCALLAFIFPLIAFIGFRACMQSFVNDLADLTGAASLGNGTGMWMLLIGFIVMLIALICNASSFCCKGGDATSVAQEDKPL